MRDEWTVARPSMVVGMAMGLASLLVVACRGNCNGWSGVTRWDKRLSGSAAPGVAYDAGWAAKSPQALSDGAAGWGRELGCRALRCLLVGAAEYRLLMEQLGCGGRWHAAAFGLPLQRAFATRASR